MINQEQAEELMETIDSLRGGLDDLELQVKNLTPLSSIGLPKKTESEAQSREEEKPVFTI